MGNGGAVGAGVAARALAQAGYPDRPVRLIVPFPPGGAFDTVGRPWADRIKPHLGTVVIENIGGAGGGVGAAAGHAFAPGRLHAAARRRDHPHHRGAAQDQADLRSAQGPGADLADRGHGLRDRRPSVGAGQGPQGAGRLRQSQSRQDVLRLRRPRLAQPSHRRTVQAQDRPDRLPARAVSRRGAGADRSAGRANSRAGAGDDQHRRWSITAPASCGCWR